MWILSSERVREGGILYRLVGIGYLAELTDNLLERILFGLIRVAVPLGDEIEPLIGMYLYNYLCSTTNVAL